MGAAAQGGDSLATIDNSVLFEGAGTLTFTPSTTETNGKKYTHSLWANHYQLTNYTHSGYNDYIYSSATVVGYPSEISFHTSNDGIYVMNTNGSSYSGYKQSTAQYRDLGAWYHVFVVFDSTLSVAGDRLQVFINGKRITAWTQDVDPGADSITSVGKGSVQQIYGTYYNLYRDLNARLAEIYFVDGTALDVTDFGEYDSTGLYWTPKDPATIADTVTYGNNGWYLNFSNASNLGEDFSGNDNDFVAANLTQSFNTPTNQYPYQNPLTLTNSYPSSLTKGNLKQTGNSAGSFASGTLATLPCDGGGKFYWEIKVIGTYTTNGYSSIGIAPMDLPRYDNVDPNGNFCLPGQQDYQGVSTTFNTGTTTNLRANSLGVNDNIGSSYTVATGSFMQIAFDSATQKVWFGKDNTWYNSGDPANGTNPTVTLTATDKFWYPWIGTYTASDIFEINYGESDFEYTPPTDFNKVNTTQIASDISRTLSDTTKYFDTILYEGNGTGQRVGAFQPFGNSFTIDKSALFDDANSESLTRTFSTPTSANIWTFSTWLKRGDSLSAGVVVLFGGTYNKDLLLWNGGTDLYTLQNGVTGIDFKRTLEDTSQWFHVVWTQSGTTSTGYINGVQVVTGTATNDTINESGITHYIGNRATSAAPYDGYVAETVFIDGSALAPSNFGQTDTSTNRWIPKDVSGLTFGNNGFYLDYSNGSDLGEDYIPSGTTSYDITVANPGSGNKYYIDTVLQATEELIEGATYKFDQSDSSNAGHPLRFSTTSDGTHGGGSEYTTGVTTSGTPGSAGAYTQIVVAVSAPVLYYYCSSHSGMGGTANTKTNNDWTNNNTVVQTADSPTINANVWNPSNSEFSGGTFSNGNRTVVTGSSEYAPVQAGIPISSGKWYCEVVPQSSEASYLIGLTKGLSTTTTEFLGSLANDVAYYGNGNLYMNGDAALTYGASYAQNDVIGMAIDLDNNTLTYYKNGASQGIIDLPGPSSVNHPYYVACCHYWSAGTGTYLLRSLASDWTGTAPTGHLAIIQDNMSSSDQFISAFSWIKNRETTDNWQLFDRVRGPYYSLITNAGTIGTEDSTSLQRFLAGGAQIGSNAELNTANESYVLWNFMMQSTGSGTVISDGMTKISDSSTTAITQLKDLNLGMSITTYTGLGAHPATIQHGLGVAPALVIVSKYSGSGGGYIISSHFGSGNEAKWLYLFDDSALVSNSTVFNGAYPTATTFSVGTNAVTNGTVGGTYVAYCFAQSEFISIGSYEGNANANGTFVPTLNSLGIPIQPVFQMTKDIDAVGPWVIGDTSRSPFNQQNAQLQPDLTTAEISTYSSDIDTGGFKMRTSNSYVNGASTFVYMAIGTPLIDPDGRIIAGR